MSSRKSKPFHHGNLRAALLEAALELLDEGGVDKITIRAVARQTGVSHAAPFNHFPDRSSLLTAVAEHSFRGLLSSIERAMQRAPQGDADALRIRIVAFADAVVRYGMKHPDRYRLLWRRDILDTEDPDLTQAVDALYDLLINEISQADPGSKFDTETIAIGLWSMCHGYVSLRLDGNLTKGKDSVTSQPRLHAMIDALLAPLFV